MTGENPAYWPSLEPEEIAVKVGDEWVGLGKALADMEDRLLVAIAYAGRVPEVHPDRPVPPRFGPNY